MAREFTTGKAQAVTPEDFNERVKRLLAGKPEPLPPEPRLMQLTVRFVTAIIAKATCRHFHRCRELVGK